jgi:hypothetical protein
MAHRTSRDSRIVVVAFVGAMLMTMFSPAYASNFSFFYADNRDQSYYYDANHTAGARAATTWTIEYSYQPTFMYWYYTTSGIHTSNDIWYTVGSVSPGRIGETTCRALQDPDECEHWHTVYKATWWETASDVARRSLACHETGHTTGLKHDPPYGCLEEGQTWNQYLGTHNTNHLNARYSG